MVISLEQLRDLNLGLLKEEARSHWKRHLPKYYRNLKKSGELEKRLENAAKFTLDAFNVERGRLMEKGWDAEQANMVAWELVREEWILLRSEDQ